MKYTSIAEALFVVLVGFLFVAVVISFTLFIAWMNYRADLSCQDLKESHFKNLPAGCV